ncbi:hypothetical protein BB561_000127 [Smittium simulii]|uniref:RGS domain-containing protein n=1 Tax=Smittium simulii TaxID=133385 RepID=A0A2T9Z0M5_9FUNG|nr:hypothetical protein BB561_000127 [Smittium simulii]
MLWKKKSNTTNKISEKVPESYISISEFSKNFTNDISSILNSKISISYLFISLILDFSPEVLLFYLEVNEYLKNQLKPKEYRKNHAQKIINTFIKSSSPLEININSSIKQSLLDSMFNEDIPLNIFQKSHAQAFKQLESNLTNFIQKPIYFQMINHIVAFNNSFEKKEQIYHVIASQITLALKKSYGIYVLDSETLHSDADYLRSKSTSLTSSDLRTSLEAWARIFANKYLNTNLPTYNESCTTVEAMNPGLWDLNRKKDIITGGADSETTCTLKAYISSNSAPAIPDGLRGFANDQGMSNTRSIFDTISTRGPSMITQKKSQFFRSKWLFWSKKET